MKLKIRNSEVASCRVTGDFYFEMVIRAKKQKITINDFLIKALERYMKIKNNSESNSNEQPTE